MFSLPQPKVDFINSRAFRSSLCKLILKTNSKPITSPSLFLRVLHKKLDSASQIPTNHSINLISIFGIDNTSWVPLIFLRLSLLFSELEERVRPVIGLTVKGTVKEVIH